MMPRGRATSAGGTLVTTAETVICTLSGISTPAGDALDFTASIDLTTGTATTAVVVRIRRGVDTTGAAVNTVQATNLAAGQRVDVPIQALDQPAGELAGASYVLTAQQTAATGNGTVNSATLEAVW